MPVINPPFTIDALRAQFAAGALSARQLIEEIFRRADAPEADPATWIYRVPLDQAWARADALDALGEGPAGMPLFGIPFAVKDNIDVAGIPTSAGCPAFAYTPDASAPAVQRLLDAGAILIGKTNLDQFATGLVGTRSPHGAPRCVFNRDYVSGGSSSGSAVAVAGGIVAFALGTDTAGSGRVPAAFNNIVGLKPTRGGVSTRGVVPACRSLDCVSILTHTIADARTVLDVIEGYDADDPYSRARPTGSSDASGKAASPSFGLPADASLGGRGGFSFGIPEPQQLRFFGDIEAEALFKAAIARLTSIGGEPKEIDYRPFASVAEMLYDGPWVAERDAAIGDFLRGNPDSVHPVVRTIVSGAARFSARDAFEAMYRLEALRQKTARALAEVDILVLPTTGTIYRVDDVIEEPFALNANLGYYTNFMNLLDLCGLALPAGFRGNRTPFGITLIGPAWGESILEAVGSRYEMLSTE